MTSKATIGNSQQFSGILNTPASDYSGNQITWEDSEWQFYETTCAFNQTVNVTLSFSGSLYLNLVVFVDQSATGNQKYAWDITHCGLDFSTDVPAAYSVSILRILKLRVLNRRCTPNLNSTVDKKCVYLSIFCRWSWQLDLHNYM